MWEVNLTVKGCTLSMVLWIYYLISIWQNKFPKERILPVRKTSTNKGCNAKMGSLYLNYLEHFCGPSWRGCSTQEAPAEGTQWSAHLLQRLWHLWRPLSSRHRSAAGCSLSTLPQAIFTIIFLSTCLYLCTGQIYLMSHEVHIFLGMYLGVQRRAEGIAITVKPAATSLR